MITYEHIEKLKPFQARAIIEGLRKGIVPADYISFFTVGRQNWLKFVEEDLDNYISEGGSKVRFINGDYGDGKTHFMSVIQNLGLQKNFASSFVVITKDTPIHKFELTYQEIVAQIKGKFEGTGICSLVDDWINKQGTILESYKEGKEAYIEALCKELRQLPGMNLNFVNALIALLTLYYFPVEEKENEESPQAILYQWLSGGKVSKKDLRPFHIFESLNKANSKTFLCSLISFLRYTDHSGLILLFDELETVLTHGSSARNAAYENIRLLMDNTEFSEYLHIFFSIIPDVLLTEKGFKSYDALWSRVRSVGDCETLNYRGIQIDLHRTPLTVEELQDLGIALRRIHEISYRWSSADVFTDDSILQICKAQQEMGILSEVRLFVKLIIRYLDMIEQNGNIETLNVSENIVAGQEEIENEKTRKLEPLWDQ